jgi:hypothetical protein
MSIHFATVQDFHQLAQRARVMHRYQTGLTDVQVEGAPAAGLRYKFDEEASASRFMILRGILRHHDPGTGSLRIDGRDVVEVWA